MCTSSVIITKMISMDHKIVGIGLLVAVVVFLELCGQRGLRADVLPGEDEVFNAAEAASEPTELPVRIPMRILKPEEKPAIVARLRKAAAQLGPYEAELHVDEFVGREQKAGPSVRFLLRAWGQGRWRVVDVEGDGGLFVSASSKGIDGGLPWQQAHVHVGPGPVAPGLQSPLVVPEWLLDARYLEGVNEQLGLAKFFLKLEILDWMVVEISVDLATGTVRHIVAKTKDTKNAVVQYVTSFRSLSESSAAPEMDRERESVCLVEVVAEPPRVRPGSAKR